MRLFGCILGLGALVAPAFAGAAQPIPKMIVGEVGKAQPVTLRAMVLSPSGLPAPAEDIAGRPELAPKPPKPPKVAKITAGGRLQNFLINHEGIKNVEALLQDRRMARFSASMREMLVKGGQALDVERKSMLPEAARLDAWESKLLNERARLQSQKDQLDSELADLKRQIADHNARCNPAPDEATYRWCVGNAQRLNSWRDDYNRRVAQHNQQVEQYKAAVADFRSQWDSFVATLGDWDARVSQFGGELQDKLSRPTEHCQFLTPAPNGNCFYQCEFRGTVPLPPISDGTCPDRDMPVLGPGDWLK